MAAKRVGNSSIDWVAFAARVPKLQKTEYNIFKGKCDSYLRRVVALPETLPKIHWDQYKTRVAVAGMVEEFQKHYDTLKVPYPADNYTTKINQVEKDVMVKVQEFCAQSQARVEEQEKELTRWHNMIPLTEMTIEELVEEFPDRYPNLDNPTMWPHTEDVQPGYVPPEGTEEGHH